MNKQSEIEQFISNVRKEIRFSTVDFIVENIVNFLEAGRMFSPNYQRNFIWDNNRRCRFIESILIGLPIPSIFLYRDNSVNDGKLEIVDGVQRVRTIYEYVKNNFTLSKMEKLPILEGTKFEDLPPKYNEIFLTSFLRIIILDSETSIENRKELFNRLNTSSLQLVPIEVVKGSLDGPFINFIEQCSKEQLFIDNCKITENKKQRNESYELLLRFFAYSEKLDEYKSSVKDFIFNYATEKTSNGFNKEEMKKEFEDTFSFIQTNNISIPKKGKKSISRTRFEAITVGTNLALRENTSLKRKKIDLIELNSEEFDRITSSDAANNKSKLEKRINFVKDLILSKGEK